MSLIALKQLGITIGSYTPTLTGVTNVTSSGAFTSWYIQFLKGSGSLCFGFGRVSITPTAAGNTVLRFTLPPVMGASVFSAPEQCSGAAGTAGGTGGGARIQADNPNATAQFHLNALLSASADYSYIYGFVVP